MPRTPTPSRVLKELPRPSGGDPGSAPSRHAHRTVVAGRGAGWPEERHYPPLGQAGGTRPSAPKVQRPTSAYIYGAICPAQGKGAALVLPRCKTEAMTLHLAEISAAVAPNAHAVLLLDQAGWHLSAGLDLPANITLRPLPAKCPELNPVENVWQFMRGNWLSNRIFNPTTTSLIITASPGTASPISRGASCSSDYANGPMGDHYWDLV